MSKKFIYTLLPAGFILMALAAFVPLVTAQTATPAPTAQVSESVAHGSYLALVGGCIFCHTPALDKYKNPTLDDLKILAFSELGALDTTNRAFSGGRDFPLGPLGTIYSRNLTSDKETGLGKWTDDEIKTALRTGKTPSGHILFPLMPYPTFTHMAESDMDDLIAYLRSLAPISNKVEYQDALQGPAPLPLSDVPKTPPDPKDTEARGKYLISSILVCSDCHTPTDATTGAPNFDMYLAGGQPFDGPWGTVYGGNITPDKDTGIGSWTDAELRTFLTTGVYPNGRRAVVMPWQITQALTSDDLDAVIYFLRNDLKPISNEIPAPALNEGFTEIVHQ